MTNREAMLLILKTLSMTPIGPDIQYLAMLRDQEAELLVDLSGILGLVDPQMDVAPLPEKYKMELEVIYTDINTLLNSLLK